MNLSDYFQHLDMPAWAVSDDAQVFFMGFALACFIRVFRAGLRWIKRLANEHSGSAE